MKIGTKDVKTELYKTKILLIVFYGFWTLSQICRITYTQVVQQQDAEENSWTKNGGRTIMIEKIA
jgi:hypothetical protein